MGLGKVFMTTTRANAPLDAALSVGDASLDNSSAVSEFITVQSFTNFAAMTGAITATWHALQRLFPEARSMWIPYVLSIIWGIISLSVSLEGLKQNGGGNRQKLKVGTVLAAIFIAFVNSLILAGAVIGTSVATGSQ
jgi:hypothetical protein